MDDGANGHAQGEREEGVADRHEAALVESAERPGTDVVQRTGPPRHEQAAEAGGRHAGQPEERQLGQRPAGPRNALRPGQAERPALELARQQRRAPEDAEQAREDEDHHPEPGVPPVVAVDQCGRGGRAVSVRTATGDGGVVVVEELGAEHRHQHAERDQGDQGDDSLQPELPDREPNHDDPRVTRRGHQFSRWRTNHTQAPASARARTTKSAVSTAWNVQNRLAGW